MVRPEPKFEDGDRVTIKSPNNPNTQWTGTVASRSWCDDRLHRKGWRYTVTLHAQPWVQAGQRMECWEHEMTLTPDLCLGDRCVFKENGELLTGRIDDVKQETYVDNIFDKPQKMERYVIRTGTPARWVRRSPGEVWRTMTEAQYANQIELPPPPPEPTPAHYGAWGDGPAEPGPNILTEGEPPSDRQVTYTVLKARELDHTSDALKYLFGTKVLRQDPIYRIGSAI